MRTQWAHSAPIRVYGPCEHPLFESVVGQSPDVFTTYDSRMVANMVLHVSTQWGMV